jgi:hypothetical protein
MNIFVRVSNALATKALGTVDAGACTTDRGCCCNSARTRGLDCYSNCIVRSCHVLTSDYGQPCGGGV